MSDGIVNFNSGSADEFKKFLDSYPRKLERNIFGACEPPLVTYNDFERAPYWPDSVVASCDGGGGGYRIISDIDAPVPDNGKRDTDTPIFDANGVEVEEGDRVIVGWGTSWSKDGATKLAHLREHAIYLRDPGTKYEKLCLSGCANGARRTDLVVVEKAAFSAPEKVGFVRDWYEPSQ